jgi:hypothetical protein
MQLLRNKHARVAYNACLGSANPLQALKADLTACRFNKKTFGTSSYSTVMDAEEKCFAAGVSVAKYMLYFSGEKCIC